MRAATKTAIVRLSDYPWLENVGNPLESMPGIIAVTSWEQATVLSTGESWQAIRLQMKNSLASQVNTRNWQRFSTWNEVVREIKAECASFMIERIQRPLTERGLSELIYQGISWDILLTLLEIEYEDIYPPKFFPPILEPWYAAGRYPCGWTGPIIDTSFKGPLPLFELYLY